MTIQSQTNLDVIRSFSNRLSELHHETKTITSASNRSVLLADQSVFMGLNDDGGIFLVVGSYPDSVHLHYKLQNDSLVLVTDDIDSEFSDPFTKALSDYLLQESDHFESLIFLEGIDISDLENVTGLDSFDLKELHERNTFAFNAILTAYKLESAERAANEFVSTTA